MRKVQFTAVVWTMILAVPLTALALSLTAYITENLTEIATQIYTFSRDISVGGRGFLTEFAARWPEVAGMIIGQIVILTIYLFARQSNKVKNSADQNNSK